MGYRALIDSGRYDSRICGMIPELAQEARAATKLSEESRQTWALLIKANFEKLLTAKGHRCTVGLSLGTVMREDWSDCKQTEDVIIVLLSDPLDIDSKQMTLIKKDHAEKDALFMALYKVNPCKAVSDPPAQ